MVLRMQADTAGATAISLLGLVPGPADTAAALAGVALNGNGVLTNGTEAVTQGQSAVGDFVDGLFIPDSSSEFGPRATDIRNGGQVGPSGEQLRNAGLAQVVLQGARSSASAAAGTFGAAAAFDESDPFVIFARQVIEEMNDLFLDDALSSTVEDGSILRSLLSDGLTNINSAIMISGSQSETDVDNALASINQISLNFRTTVENAQDVFLAAADAIRDIATTEDELVTMFIDAKNAYFDTIIEAIETFGEEHQAATEAVGDAIMSTYVDTVDLSEAVAADFNLLVTLAFEQVDLLNRMTTIAERLLEFSQTGDLDPSLVPDLQQLLSDLDAFDAAIAATGFDSLNEFARSVVQETRQFAEALFNLSIPVGFDLNDVFVLVEFEDGTIIRDTIAAGESYSVNGVVDTTAIIRFYDPSTNQYVENEIEFTEDGSFGRSILSEVLTLDSDGDGLGDLGEFVIGSDPNNIDTDGDGA